jgi:hypothetical protein
MLIAEKNINTRKDKSNKIIHNQREIILNDLSKKYKIKHFYRVIFYEKNTTIRGFKVFYNRRYFLNFRSCLKN